MKELAMVVQNANEEVSVVETIEAIKKANFKNVFVQWYDDAWDFSQENQVALCKKLGFNIIFAHLGYQNMNDIWRPGTNGDEMVDRFQNDIKNCKEQGISLVVMHLVGGNIAPMYNELGLKRIRKITEYAKKLGVKVAFENTRIEGYLEYVLENIKDDNVGICFDTGHCHAFFDDKFSFDLFKNRIFAVHIHDNDSSGDLHLLPFDGTINWEDFISRLKEANYDGPVTLELCYRCDYLNMPIDEFYKIGYERGLKLKKILEDKK